MRLFVAFPVPLNLADKLHALVQTNRNTHLRIPKKENFHITIFFLGEVEEKYLNQINQELEIITSKTPKFFLIGEDVKLMPPSNPKTMLWFCFKKSEEFEGLVKEVYEKLKPFTLEKSWEKPIAHITLARSKEMLSEKELPSEKVGEIKLGLESIELWQSHLGSKPFSYTKLKSFSLK